MKINTFENYREYFTEDKATWQRGEWDTEPDKAQWIDPATGLDCLIKRNRVGALCGYVGVPSTHQWHGKSYNDVDVDAHGGLSYSDACETGVDEANGICHIPATGRADHVWWFGFDCAHGGDLCPSYRMGMGIYNWLSHDEYRNLSYVVGEVTNLATQLASLSPSPAQEEPR